jgi:hypothetical protein
VQGEGEVVGDMENTQEWVVTDTLVSLDDYA